MFEIGSDPVQLGLVASLNRPGGNITGVTNASSEMAPKRLQLLHELIPTASVIALLVNPANKALAEPAMRLAGNYTGRILKGDKPADLPVQQATRVQLYINLKTAKALGINVPNTLIGRADEVME